MHGHPPLALLRKQGSVVSRPHLGRSHLRDQAVLGSPWMALSSPSGIESWAEGRTKGAAGMTLRALVIDDQRLFAEALQGVLERLGLEATVATSGSDGLALAGRERPDLVLVDLRLRDSDGLDVGRRILHCSPETAVIAVTVCDGTMIGVAEEAGFLGVVPKDISLSGFVNAVMSALEGRRFMPWAASAPGRSPINARSRDIELLAAQLTPRELQVLELLVDGRAGSEISSSLGIGFNTVRTHIQSVLTKLQVHSRLEAAGFAVRNGLVPPRWEKRSGVAS